MVDARSAEVKSAPEAASKLQAALGLAAAGFRVFPLDCDSKVPLYPGGPHKATTDEAMIRRWWTCPVLGWEQDWNIGLATGGGTAVLDVDDKGEKRGSDTLAELTAAEGQLPATVASLTPSGGRHLFFRVSEDVANSAGRLGHGLDVRGRGGYVVAPGSTIGGKAYAWAPGRGPDSMKPATCPGWLHARMAPAPAPRQTANDNRATTVALDTDAALARARHYLANDAPLAVQGDGGDHTTYCVAARLKDFGASESTALDLMLDHWNDRCSPPWAPDDLARKVANAFRYGQNPPGVANPAAQFPPRPGGQREPTPARRLPVLTFNEIELPTEQPALVAGLLDHGALSVVYGEPNAGKSFFVLDLALSVARGLPWRGNHAVEQRVVLYIAAEAAGSLKGRIVAYRKHHGLDGPAVPFAIVPASVDLFGGPADADEVIARSKDMEARFGLPVGLVVVDTLARAMAGGDENTAKDMGALIRNVGRIGTGTGAHVLLVHHSGKDRDRGARGHSSLRAAVDTEIEVTSDPKTKDAPRVARVTKQRERESGQRFAFTLPPIAIGGTADNTPLTSCVVQPVDLAAGRAVGRPEPMGQARSALDVLRTLAAEASSPASGDDAFATGGACVPRAAWRARFVAHASMRDKSKDARKKAFSRAEAWLVRKGHVQLDGHGVRLL